VAKARALRPFQETREPDLWAFVLRSEWILSMRRKRICAPIRRRALLYLDRERPGTKGSTVTNEAAWREIEQADRRYRQATGTAPAEVP